MRPVKTLAILSVFALLSFLSVEAGAGEQYYSLAQLMQDSLARRSSMPLDGIWNLQLGGGEWRSFQVPAPLRVREQSTLEKKFALDSSMISSVYELAFDGLDGLSTIYLNKKIIATHSAGSAPFALRIGKEDLFVNEENELVVQLDGRLDYRRSLPLLVRNRGIPLSGNGLFRPLVLRSGKTPFVSAVTISPAKSNSQGLQDFDLRATVALGGMDSLAMASFASLHGQVEIVDGQTSQVLFVSPLQPLYPSAGDTTSLQVTAGIPGFRYWAPGVPQRYRIVVQLSVGAEVIDRAAIWFALSRPGQWLAEAGEKGSGFRYRAVDWVEDERQILLPQQEQRKVVLEDLRGMIALGANTVRLPGGMPGDFFLQSCDSLGLAVLIEIPVTHIPSAHLNNAAIRQKARNALHDMIRACRSHPCVAAWGLGNGYDPADPRAQAFVRDFAGIARELDDRPVYAGIRGKKVATHTLPVDLQIVEVPPEKTVTFAQGAWRTSGPYLLQLTSPLDVRNSSERSAQQNQAYYLKSAIVDAQRKSPGAGLLISPWKDWRGEAPHTFWGPRADTHLFHAGLLDEQGQERLVCQVAKAAFTNTEMPELLPADVPLEDPPVFQIISIVLIVLLLFYIRTDKRMSHYLKRVFIYPHGFYMDLIENRQVNPFLTGVMGLASFVTMSTLLASLIFFLRENSLFDELLTWLFPSGLAKNQAIALIWNPERMIALLTAVMVGMALLQSFLYKLVVLWQRRFLRFSQILTFTFWVPANFIFALPLAVVLFRALSRSNLVTLSLIYFGIILFWFFVRVLRGTRVILQITFFRALLVLAAGLFFVALAIGIYLEQTRALTAFASYYWSLLGQ